MCGRYAASADPDQLVEEFEVEDDETGGLEPDWNVAPTKSAPVVVQRVRREDRRAAEDDPTQTPEPVRQLRSLVWGLVPSWSKDRSGGARMINARADSLLTKPAFKRAAATRRAIVPADGWYEWQKSPSALDAKGRPRKQPFLMTRRDGGRVALAGIYEFWKDPSVDPDDAGCLADDVRGGHHRGRGRPRPDPRPDARGARPRPLGGLARPRARPTRRRSASCSSSPPPAGSGACRWARW